MESSMNHAMVSLNQNGLLGRSLKKSCSVVAAIKQNPAASATCQVALAVGISMLMVTSGFAAAGDPGDAIPKLRMPDGSAISSDNPFANLRIVAGYIGAFLILCIMLWSFIKVGGVSIKFFGEWADNKSDLGKLGVGLGVGFGLIVINAGLALAGLKILPITW
jgi:hypothetical protein